MPAVDEVDFRPYRVISNVRSFTPMTVPVEDVPGIGVEFPILGVKLNNLIGSKINKDFLPGHHCVNHSSI